MEVTRTQGFNEYYNYSIYDEEKKLSFYFGGNLDSYWSITKTNSRRPLTHETFKITKENYFIYSLFSELFTNIRSGELFPLTEEDFLLCETKEEELELITRHEEESKRIKKSFQYQLMFDGNKITWHSDEEPYDVTNIVTIEEGKEEYNLEFKKQPKPQDYHDDMWIKDSPNIYIRFRNSGSTYDPLNFFFMNFFNKLQEYNPDYHQIHIEELPYIKKKERK